MGARLQQSLDRTLTSNFRSHRMVQDSPVRSAIEQSCRPSCAGKRQRVDLQLTLDRFTPLVGLTCGIDGADGEASHYGLTSRRLFGDRLHALRLLERLS